MCFFSTIFNVFYVGCKASKIAQLRWRSPLILAVPPQPITSILVGPQLVAGPVLEMIYILVWNN